MPELRAKRFQFLQLPRELRDQIYEYYLHDDDGLFYHYAPGGGKLQYCTNEKQAQLQGLLLTCRTIANEARLSLLSTNAITFTPILSDNDGAEFRGLRSRAGRFEALLNYTRRAKMHMLSLVAPYVTLSTLDQVTERYPSVARYYRSLIRQFQRGHEQGCSAATPLEFHFETDPIVRYQFSVAFCDAIQYTLDLVSIHPDFDRLTAMSCTTDLVPEHTPSIFLAGTHEKVLAWRPEWWAIPTDADLALETSLAESPPLDEWNTPEPPAPISWYFSATAAAINCFKHLRKNDRRCIKKVFIREDRKGVGHPECHVRGLLCYCAENPALRVEIHVGIWTNLVPSVWLEYKSDGPRPADKLTSDRFLVSFADWVVELTPLAATSQQSITFILEGNSQETNLVWNIIKSVAGLQEAMAASDQCRANRDDSLSGIIHPLLEIGVDHDALFPRARLQVPSDLPQSFANEIRRIVDGTSVVHFDGDPGEIWELHELVRTRKEWSILQFWEEWYSLQRPLPFPPGGIKKYLESYGCTWYSSQEA
ncbi:hypothetical protein BDV96DRAFT_578433 [Lophiotrema nucula]|uniref:Uncharacterized protein n=1 Tax=Lophiotrema nucula TaxID=690887 RepID=A0A6A5Z453_9PLEO|nr:hypothetical protein BDV96DRAFT_578433 [Lophiotrema nucula]